DPHPNLIDAYFDPLPNDAVGVLAGEIVDVAANSSLAARYVVARRRMSQRVTLQRGRWGYAQSGNCAVRRAAFMTVGGFQDDIRVGEDADLCFRLTAAGWRVEQRPGARVDHPSPRTLGELIGQVAGHGRGVAWLNRRYPGSFPAARPRDLLRRVPHYLREAARALRLGEPEEVAFALVELACLYTFDLGRALPNRATRPPGGRAAPASQRRPSGRPPGEL
ncbi:MAG TPA: glycosyltransferase family 2 protein, partial [Solirubrobacteraceae bacterium]|nr:glycosyltransferase family 2 protein [Solirubrobacteraceae bacterium]